MIVVTFVTQVLAAIFAVLFFVYVIRLVSKGNLSLRFVDVFHIME